MLKTINAKTNEGPYLKVNEDGYSFNLESKIFSIADGFGGAGIGDKCVQESLENITLSFSNMASDLDTTLPYFYNPKFLVETNILINAIIDTHKKLYNENQKKSHGQRAGLSGVFCCLVENTLCLVSIGNCRSYQLRQTDIKKVFIEDSLDFHLGDGSKPHTRSFPLSGIGVFPDLTYQVKEIRVQTDDKIILASDGLYNYLRDEEIEHHLGNDRVEVKERMFKSFELANKRGNLDNQTCMLLEF